MLLVATDHTGRILGYTAAHPADGELSCFSSTPPTRDGIGRTLLNAAHDELGAAGCTQAFLFVHEHNKRALAFTSDFKGAAIREPA